MILLISAYYLDAYLSSRNNFHVQLDFSETLAGTDNDKNGIRDDMDEYIEVLSKVNHYNEKQVNALKQIARTWQSLVNEDLKSSESVNKTEILNYRSCGCILSQFHDREAIRIRNKMKDYTFNTQQRLTVYMQHVRVADSLSSTVPDSKDCDNK